jgi:3-oxoacyl-[acyl-carrier-protein] synthase-3
VTATATLAGWGVALPETRLTNADLERRLDTDDQWIRERTGIAERRIAAADESSATLAGDAAAAAMKHADLTPDDVQLLIVATASPAQPLPGTSAFVADRLGLRCGAFDLGAACAGFVYAMVTAASLLESGGLGAAVVVGAETMSRIVDPEDRTTAVLFGDAAAAVALVPTLGTEGSLIAWDLGCDGSAARLLEIPSGERYLRMEGREVFRRAVRVVVESSIAVLERAGMTVDDVDLFVPHQANARMIEAIGDRLGVPRERVVTNIERYGNTSAASIPLALAEAADSGRLHDGDVVLLSGFGAGMTWASALLRWKTP